ncbi:MAG: (2Fe-2S)-binding protein [Acidobacteria bacterium]|nr:(2Fe-2S)-binding protein [Acidobacteriota bacterium]MCL5289023.1 (2Fe-2S)-binding protein [Acidobacteriota bacterium]
MKQTNWPPVMACPVSGKRSKQVDLLTVRSLLRQLPLEMPSTAYYFCDDPTCDAVYFPSNPEAPIFRRSDLLVRVGTKETEDPIPVCYCFGFTRQDIWDEIRQTGRSTVGERITAEVKAGNCACEVRNPSGKCCLGNVARYVQDGPKVPQSNAVGSADFENSSRKRPVEVGTSGDSHCSSH